MNGYVTSGPHPHYASTEGEVHRKPLAIDLFCGLGGWAEGFLAEGYDVIGFDIKRHRYPERDMSASNGRKVATDGVDFQKRGGTSRERSFNYANQCTLRESPLTGGWVEYPGQLVLRDVLTLHGSQFRNAAMIVASPPCQAYSYRAMPWKRAKALPPPSNEMFDACFRIQREANEAAYQDGCVHCGIFHPATRLDGCEFQARYIPLVVENVKGAQPWVGRARWHYGSFYLWGDVPALMPHTFRMTKGLGGGWFDKPYKERGDITGRFNSKSQARKQASAEIAKIPFDLANHIARVYRPVDTRKDSVCNGVEPLDFGGALR